MDVVTDEAGALREELRRLQSELAEVTVSEASLRAEYDAFNEKVILSEYTTILSALAPPKRVKIRGKSPFPRLFASDGDNAMQIAAHSSVEEEEDAPDAFAFMSLMQASTSNEISLRALARKLPYVAALSSHNIEELLQLVPRLPVGLAREEVLLAMGSRFVREVSEGGWSSSGGLFAGIASVFSSERTVPKGVAELIAREAVSRLGIWSAAQHGEIAFFLAKHLRNDLTYLNGLLSWLTANSYAEELHSPRVIWQMVGALRLAGISISTNLASQLTVSAERAISKPLLGALRNSIDLHQMAIELAAVRARGTGSLWTTLVEKLAHTNPAIFEVFGTLSACLGMSYTHDALIGSNLQALRKHVVKATSEELAEIADSIVISGERNVAVCRALFERKEFFETSLAWSVLSAAACVAAAEGTTIAEGLILLKKIENDTSIQASRKLLIYLGLSPSNPLIPVLTTSAISELKDRSNSLKQVVNDRVKSLLDLLGFDELEQDYCGEGISCDFAFLAHKTCIIVENEPLYNVSQKRYQSRGWTNLKGACLSRKGWKVVLFISELYAEEKSATAYLSEQLRKVPYTSVARISSVDDSRKLLASQRLKSLVIRNIPLVEIAKLLLQVLRTGVTFDILDLADNSLPDFITEVLAEFIVTYMAKNSLNRVDLSNNHLTDSFLQRVLHAMKGLGGANKTVEIIIGGNKIENGLPMADAVKVVAGENPGSNNETGITIFLVGLKAESV